MSTFSDIARLMDSGYSVQDALRKADDLGGSFTPTIYGTTTAGTPTYTQQTGTYEKTGRTVTGRIQIIISAKGGMAGNIRIGGLPFTAASVSNGGHSPISVGYAQTLAITAGSTLTGFVAGGTNEIAMCIWDATTGVTTLLDTELTDGLNILISFTYRT